MALRLILGVDIIREPLGGMGHYALQLARGLRSHPAITQLRYFSTHRWLSDPEQGLSLNRSLDQARRWLPLKPQMALLYGAVQLGWFRHQVERFPEYLVHVPNYVLPRCANPSVATLHDLSHLHYPRFHPKERIAYLERYLPWTLEHATHLIAVSEFVRQEAIQLLGIPAARVTSVHNGVDPRFCPYPAAELRPVLERYALKHKGYLLSVATLEPRKNLDGLAHAYARLPAAVRRCYPWVLAGARGWLTGPLERLLSPLEATGQVLRLGYVPQGDLPFLYAGAQAFGYPSVYEGFGLPVLEAMASGIPVLTSLGSSLPEVGGDAALYVDPLDVSTLTTALEQLLTDGAWRATAIEKGMDRARRFSWERCVTETIAVYQRALGHPGFSDDQGSR